MGPWSTAADGTVPFNGGVLFNAWKVNFPQIILSFCYLGLNNICTFLASAEEWNNFAHTRKGLRVSRPMAEQRSTYFLQLPYKWAIPLIATSSALHWLLSQTFFLVRVDVYTGDSDTPSNWSRSACGYSSFSLLIFSNVSFLLLCAVGWALFRHMQQKKPSASSCSLVISAACHPPKTEVDTQLKKVKWGAVEQRDVDGAGHCCLSSESVKKPEVGRIYR